MKLTFLWLGGLLALAVSLPGRSQELVRNGDFESGLSDWTVWSVSNTFWNGSWIHANDCDIWEPTNGCPFAGALSHSQKKGSGGGNAHGGIYQQIAVQSGRQYRVQGQWSGGVTGNAGGNDTWWEVVVFDGAVGDAEIDAGLRAQDQLVDKISATGLATNAVFQFQWQPFEAVVTARSDLVTLAFKQGSYFTFDAAAYHDNVSMQLLAQPVLQIEKTAALLVDFDSDGSIDRGDRLRFTLSVGNPVDADALDITGLRLTDVLPAGLQLIAGSVTTTLGTITLGNTTPDVSVQVDVATLADGASVVVSFDAIVDEALPAGVLTLANQAEARADNIADTVSDDPATTPAGDATVIRIQQNQQITDFQANPPAGVFGGSASLSATAGASGNPVVFASIDTSVCTVASNLVSFVGIGACRISANQAGNADFNASPEQLLLIDVAPAPQAISFGPAPTVVVNGTGSLSASGGASGNPVLFSTASPGICDVAGSNTATITGLAVGQCTVLANQAGSTNYAAAPQASLSFAIGPASWSVGGTLSGYVGSGLVLRLNGSVDLPISTGSSQFAFPALIDGSDYQVAVAQQPTGPVQNCTVNNGQGRLAGANVTNISISCVAVPARPTVVPVSSPWALLGLAMLLGIVGFLRLGQRRA